MVYWNEKFLVLSLIFPILRAPAPVPKYWKKNTAVCLYMFVCQSSWSNLFIPLANEVWGYIFVTLSVCPSVRLSVRPSICPSVCLSIFPSVCLSVCLSVCPLFVDMILRDGCIHFYENLYTDYSPFVDVHLEFSYFSIFKLQAFG